MSEPFTPYKSQAGVPRTMRDSLEELIDFSKTLISHYSILHDKYKSKSDYACLNEAVKVRNVLTGLLERIEYLP